MILNATATRLANVFQRYCKDPRGAAKEAEPIIDELYKALGGCDTCFGRGYILLGEEYDYDTCPRGKQLKKFVENR